MPKKTFYITTAIDYASGSPHCGHMYEKILADAIARWKKLENYKVHFSTGTDEHGLKIERAAEKSGKSPKEFVDEISNLFVQLCKIYNIGYTDFIRTTEKRHEKVVEIVLEKINQKHLIYKGSYEGFYCVECENFYTEKDLIHNKCPVHKTKVELRKEEGYFFRMSDFKESLIKYIKDKEKDFIFSDNKRNEILNRLKQPLKDLSLTRKGVWGLEFPIDKKYSIFVWEEALINYLTTIDYPNKKFKEFWPAVHVIGVDIVWAHTIIWGSTLMAIGLELPQVLTHGFINLKGEKMSKSLGNVIDPFELAKRYPIDAIRYYLIREIPFGQDGDFSEEALKNRLNNELANDLGNLVSRIIAICEKNFNGKIKKSKTDPKLEEKLNLKKINELMNSYNLTEAISEIWAFVKACNKHINDEKIWEMQKEKQEKHLYSLLESIRIISLLLSPFIPETSSKIYAQIGVSCNNIKEAKFGHINEYMVKKGPILFQKVK